MIPTAKKPQEVTKIVIPRIKPVPRHPILPTKREKDRSKYDRTRKHKDQDNADQD